MSGRNVFEDDLKTKKCRLCGHEWPPDTLERGICEDCIEEIEADKAGFVPNLRKKGWDDER